MSYETQLAAKRDIVTRALRRLPIEHIEMHPAPEPWAYRRRARLHWRVTSGRVRLGYLRARSREIVDVLACPLWDPALSSAVAHMRGYLAKLVNGIGSLALLCGPGTNGANASTHVSLRVKEGRQRSLPSVDQILGQGIVGGMVARDGDVAGVAGHQAIVLDERGLRGNAACFAQANAAQDKALRQAVLAHASLRPTDHVLELFPGVGNLTVDLAAQVAKITAVESHPESVSLLEDNVRHAAANTQIQSGTAEDCIDPLSRQIGQWDVLVLDPPREGAQRVAARIREIGPDRIVYVSCDPMTLARDLAEIHAHGFAPSRATVIDMMPQTYHVETVVSLRRM